MQTNAAAPANYPSYLLGELIAIRRFMDSLTKESTLPRRRPRLKPQERQIVRTIGRGKMLGKNIAKRMDIRHGASFQTTLANMTRFGILTNDSDGEGGYCVSPEYHDLLSSEVKPA